METVDEITSVQKGVMLDIVSLVEEGIWNKSEFIVKHGEGGNCSCHLGNPPCGSCTHPGHPLCMEAHPYLDIVQAYE